MRFWRLPVVAVAAFTVSFSVKAQTADEIISKHIEAIGGKDKISAMKSLYTEADLEIQGNAGTSTSSVVFGKGSYTEIELAGQKIVNCVTADKGGWAINPFAGQTTAEPMPESQANASKAQLYPGGVLLDYATKGNKVELAGQEEVNGVKAWKLNVTTKEGTKLVIYIDPATYYITKSVVKLNMNGQEVEQGVSFSDYKKTEYGYVSPNSSTIELPGGMAINVTVRKIEVNKAIDAKIFDKP
jgi:hypothetical protein